MEHSFSTGGIPAVRWGRSPLEFHRLVTDEGAVGAGGSGSRYVTTQDGEKWIAKANFFGGQAHRYLLLNEGLGNLVARRIGAPVPDACVIELTDEQLNGYAAGAPRTARYIFATRFIDGAEPLSPDSAPMANPHDLAKIVALDTLTWNTDQKPEHVLARTREDGRFDVYAIDRGHTLAVADSLAGNLNPTAPATQPMSLLGDNTTSEQVQAACALAAEIARKEWAEMVQSLPGEWVVEPDAIDTIADALHKRAAGLSQLLAPYFL